ncbi:hypothetical protein F8O01_01875 [Pseudoclavibacter chungangensis]|uniref:Asparaginase n=1 Tax=Pseudoclavibacter chungangensis TaxID=587635 RepID=A0A7J5C0U5_9MICO|nr:asparaginase domain-containing protein [Pseudoclavibacter chungangensis]KAB1662232.1 hypothetical protein F8O01_01875 [Pseudoclavibacter chungangensis]NYJ65435.1 L-asparaginase [Pseudoclavibacter chungangensis]
MSTNIDPRHDGPDEQNVDRVADAILVVYAGGTFGMRDLGRGLEAVPDITPIVAGLMDRRERETGEPLAWDLVSVTPAIDSAEADASTAPSLARLVRRHVEAGAYRGVVIVHGTDTLAHTAARLAFDLADLDLVVACTGSQIPHGAPDSDADANFTDAVRVAAGDAAPGVRIVFGGRCLLGVRATKRSSEDLDGFTAHRAPGGSPVGVPRDVTRALAERRDAPSTPIGLLHVSPGLVPAVADAVARAYPAGFVLACYGAGTAPGFVAATVRAVAAAGAVVVAITQCEDGGVHLDRYAVGAALADAGAVDGGDLTAEAAVAKLGALVDAGLARADVVRLLGANLVGERSPA